MVRTRPVLVSLVMVQAVLVAGCADAGRPAKQDVGKVAVKEAPPPVELKEAFALKGHTRGVGSAAFSPDGKWIVSGSADGTVKVWDVSTRRERLTLKGHTSDVTSVAFSPDDKLIASGSSDKTIKVWDAHGGKEVRTFTGPAGAVSCVAFSPDSKRIASGGSGSRGGEAKIWDSESGEATLTLKGHTGRVRSVAFSPDGKLIASGSFDETVKVWDARNGEVVRTFTGHTGPVLSVAFSPDGKRIASGGWREHLDEVIGWSGGMVKVWDAATGKEHQALGPYSAMVASVAFSPDGGWIVTGGGSPRRNDLPFASHSSGELRVWDSRTGAEVLKLNELPHPINSVAFSRRGTQIVTGSDKTVQVWDLAAR